MSAITVMARLIEEELQARGISGVSRDDCAEILRAVIDRVAQISEKAIADAEALDRSR